jgi:autotransporter-associated beta strand protein
VKIVDGTELWKRVLLSACALFALVASASPAIAQLRALGVDISYWNTGGDQTYGNQTNKGITQSMWNTGFSDAGGNRKFVWIRATRGGTTGLSQTSGTPGGGSQQTLSERYDDPRFLQNIERSTIAGFYSGAYHFARPSLGNTGADEANHFLEMAGVYMRPGFLMPILDLEDGSGSVHPLAQFSIDFSNRIYQATRIRPGMYINGNHTSHLETSSTTAQDHQIAQPVIADGPSVTGPAFPMLWNARYSDNDNPNAIPIQTGSPKTTYTTVNSYYGPWDNYGDTQPWDFWQYASTNSIPGFNQVDSGIDGNVSHGDIEYVKDFLVPAVWWGDNSGDWSTLTNWNSGQPIGTFSVAYPTEGFVMPHIGAGQAAQFDTTPTVPDPRLPGAAGSGPTSGQHDTVILERPSANITVTLSTGTHNIRKLYMREALDITGGSLTINYDPTYRPDTSVSNLTRTVRHAGPISAQFSGPVSLSGAGSLSVHTAQIDAAQTFTLGGGTLTFNKINLISNANTKIAVTGDVNINPLNNATATIIRSASAGVFDLSGGMPQLTIGNGAADVDLSVAVPITNGGFVKAGSGTMRLDAANTFTGNVTVAGGTLRYGHASGLSDSSLVTVNNSSQLDMNGISDTIVGLASAADQTSGVVQQGSADLTLTGNSGDNSYYGAINGSGTFTKNGSATQSLQGNNTLGAVNLNDGSLILNGANTTGNITVNGGTLAGIGSVSGPVVVNNSGHLSPGASPGTFTAGELTLNAGSILDMELVSAGNGDLMVANGLLTLNGGTVNVLDETPVFGFYPLIYYGSLAGSVANLTAVGPEGFDYQFVDTGTSISLLVMPAGIPGDFNDDGTVDSGDYIIWKKFKDADVDLPNDNDLPGPIGLAEYGLWQQNFGRTSAGGGGDGEVPEPTSAVLVMLAVIGFALPRSRG